MTHLPFSRGPSPKSGRTLFQSRRALWLAACLATTAATPALAGSAVTVLLETPAGTQTPADLGSKLAGWREAGQISDTLWLDSKGSPGAPYQTLAVVEFPSAAAYDAWRASGGAQLGAAVAVHPASLLTEGMTWPRDSNKSVFRVETYDPSGTSAQVAAYAQGYLHPLMEQERNDKVVLRYSLYQEQQPQGHGRLWLVVEYRDPAAAARAEAVQDEAIKTLSAKDPAFARLAAERTSVLGPGVTVPSRYAELPPPSLPDLPNYRPQVHLTGTLRIYGSELKNAVEYLARGFQQYQPDVKVSWSNSTSSEGAIAGLYTGVSDVAPMGDDAKLTDEMPFYNVNGYLPTEISVATGGYEKRGSLWAWVIVVNKDNPINEISIDELERVFGSERSGGWTQADNNWLYSAEFARTKATNIRTWDQLGLHGSFAGKDIQTYGFVAPGFQIYFERNWFHWSHKWNPNFMEYVERKEAVPGPEGDAVASERPLEILSKDRLGIGISGYLHVKDYTDLKILKISEHPGGPYVAFSPETVANRSYPLKRDAYFYVNKPPGQPLDPKVKEFMRFVLSREGQEIIAKVGYYYPLDAAYLQKQLDKLN